MPRVTDLDKTLPNSNESSGNILKSKTVKHTTRMSKNTGTTDSEIHSPIRIGNLDSPIINSKNRLSPENSQPPTVENSRPTSAISRKVSRVEYERKKMR